MRQRGNGAGDCVSANTAAHRRPGGYAGIRLRLPSVTLATVIHAGLTHPSRTVTALVLMGGGARTAYQAGVLKALAAMLRLVPGRDGAFPFQVLVGTSAGAINAAALASHAMRGLAALEALAPMWLQLRSEQVYQLRVSPWAPLSKFLAAVELWRNIRRNGAVLDNMPMVDALHKRISLPDIDAALAAGALDVLAVTASSYTSGVHWTFCHGRNDARAQPWQRPGRRAEFQPISIEHLVASSAIPFLFPATPLWVDGHREWFGDGSMRQISPLSPAIHLGAHRVLVVGVGQPQRATLAGDGGAVATRAPGMGGVAGHAMASVFHDTLQADVEQTQRVTTTLQQLPREVAAVLQLRAVQVLALQPSQSLDALAHAHLGDLPRPVRRALAGLGALRGGGAALASYLLFEPGFTQALIALGEQDAFARKDELLAFFGT